MKKLFIDNSTILQNTFIFKGFNIHIKNILLILFGLFFLILSAKIKIPIPPVPITLQTLVVLVFAMSVGSKISSITFIFYLCLGSLSLPVFANPPYGGPGYLLGPSGGYLLGMLLSSYIVGLLAENNYDKNYFKSLLAIFIGTIIIFIPGILWLTYWFNFYSSAADELNFYLSYSLAIENGLLLYKYTESVKIALAATITPILWKYKDKL